MLTIYLSMLESDEERDKFTYYYEKYRSLLAKTAGAILRDANLAEDAVHETFLSVIRHKNKLFELDETNFRRWCVIITANKSKDILRKEKHYSYNSTEQENTGLPGKEEIETTLIREETRRQLMTGVEKLDELSRDILYMKYALGESMAEIGRELGLTFNQVNGKLRSARRKLREYMESEGE